MASKSHKGEKQLARIPSAVCPHEDCQGKGIQPLTRTLVVGQGGGMCWMCPQGHKLPKKAQIVRVDPPKPPPKASRR
jgi:hypothetical protein